MAGTVSPDSEIWRIISERVEAKRSTAIVVGVLGPGGRTQVFGCGDPGPGQFPLDAVSVFEIGSITNVFTAILLAGMAQRGEARLQDLVARFLPRRCGCQRGESARSSWWTWPRTPRGCRACRPTGGPPARPTRWPATPPGSRMTSCQIGS